MAKINRINPEGISKPFSNYSHVVTAEGAQKLVFCAGQVAADVDGKVLPPDDFDAQAKMVMANLTKALAAGGAKLSDVTKITIYLCNPHDVPKARGLLQTYFEGHPPGSTLCILRGLANPNFLLEIEAIAAVWFRPGSGPSKGGPGRCPGRHISHYRPITSFCWSKVTVRKSALGYSWGVRGCISWPFSEPLRPS